MPAGTLSALPPELLAFVRAETWKQGARFRGGVPGDLYALGVLLYEALTDFHPFDPKLPVEALVAAIETTLPPAPHEVNPGVPRALSDMAMRLLAKTPDARFASAEALLQALWDARKEERTHPWRVPLPIPPEGMGRHRQRAKGGEAAESGGSAPPALEERREEGPVVEEQRPAGVLFTARVALRLLWAFTSRRVRWLGGTLGALLALWLIWAALAPPPLKGSAPVSTRDSRLSRLLVLLCTTTGLGCSGAQIIPPARELCPEEAMRVMFSEFRLTPGLGWKAIIDVAQPGEAGDTGTYRDGPIIGRVTKCFLERDKECLPRGTLLYGRLWTGPGIYDESIPPSESVIGRYTRALLPDGREVPVCIQMDAVNGRVHKLEGSTSEAARLPREVSVGPVLRWQ